MKNIELFELTQAKITNSISQIKKNFNKEFRSKFSNEGSTFTPEDLENIFDYRVEWEMPRLLNELSNFLTWTQKNSEYEIKLIQQVQKTKKPIQSQSRENTNYQPLQTTVETKEPTKLGQNSDVNTAPQTIPPQPIVEERITQLPDNTLPITEDLPYLKIKELLKPPVEKVKKVEFKETYVKPEKEKEKRSIRLTKIFFKILLKRFKKNNFTTEAARDEINLKYQPTEAVSPLSYRTTSIWLKRLKRQGLLRTKKISKARLYFIPDNSQF